MRLLQFLFLMSGLIFLNIAIADEKAGDHEPAPVNHISSEQDDGYDDGDYSAAPLSWDAKKKIQKPDKPVKQPKKKVVKKISKPQQQGHRQRWAKLKAGTDAFE